GQQDVARDHHVLGGRGLAGQAELGGDDALVDRAARAQGRVLGVADDRRAERQGVFHGPAVEAGVHDALSVVREGDAGGFGQRGRASWGSSWRLRFLVTAPIGYTRRRPSTLALARM